MQFLYKTVKGVLDSGRIGSPVFVRCLAQIASDREHLIDVFAEERILISKLVRI